MKKLSIEEIEQVISRAVDNDTKTLIMSEIVSFVETQDEGEDDPTTLPTPETRSITILVGASDVIEPINTDQLYAYTVSCEIERDHNDLIRHLVQKATEFNSKKKKRSSKVYSLSEVFESLKPKKDLDLYPKKIFTKESAMVLKTVNLQIPTTQNVVN